MAQFRCDLFAGMVLYESSVEIAQGRLQKKRSRQTQQQQQQSEDDDWQANSASKVDSPTSAKGGESITVRPDTDNVPAACVYSVPPLKLLVIGKYVPALLVAATATAASSSSATAGPTNGVITPQSPYDQPARRSSATSSGGGARRQHPLPFPPPKQDVAEVSVETHVAKAKASSNSLHRPCSATGTLKITAGETRSYEMVENVYRYPISVGTIFFPIAYSPKPNAKEKADPRGLPQDINRQLHGPYAMPTYQLQVRADNMNKIALFKIGPGAVAFKVVVNAFEGGGLLYTHSDALCSILWAKRVDKAFLGAMHPYQKVNHFPGSWGIGRKDNLHRNVTKMRRLFGAGEFDVAPRTFLIPAEYDELQVDAKDGGGSRTYIVKPVASSCGKGIYLSRGLPALPKSPHKSMLVQHYVPNPMLIEKRKFDLRMYCVVTGVDPLRIFLLDEGLVRFAAERYAGADCDLENSYMHLTNYSVSKTAELKRGAADDDDDDDPVDIKWTLSDMQRRLKETHGEERGGECWAEIVRQCKDVTVKTILSIEANIVEECRASCRDPTGRGCFELFGLDLMVDDKLKVSVIEVNIMPSLATGANIDKAVKARMLAHMLTLVGVVPHLRSADLDASKDARGPPPVPKQRYLFTPASAAARHTRQGAKNKEPAKNVAAATSAPSSSSPSAHSGSDAEGTATMDKGGVTTIRNPPFRFDVSGLTAAERAMLVECDEEVNRAGGFERIYPASATVCKYLPLFSEGVQRNNYLLAAWECMKALKQV